MKELPKDLAARVSRPIPVANQLRTLQAELEAAKIEERQFEAFLNQPGQRVMRIGPHSRESLPPLKAVPAKRPNKLPNRPILAANPVVVNPDAEDQRFIASRGRNMYLINFANEWLLVTSHTLAMACSKQPNGYILNEEELAKLAESIRKSNLEKACKGKQPYLTKEETPSRMGYRLTAYGASYADYKMPTGNENDAQRLSKTFDASEVLAVATVAARLGVPSEIGSWGEGNSDLEPGLAVFSSHRIRASHTRSFSSADEARAAQRATIEKWVTIPEKDGGLPRVKEGWTLGRMDERMYARVHNAFLTPIPGSRGGNGLEGEDDVWAGSLFETYTDKGQPEGLIDGVIAGPWIAERDEETKTVYCRSGFSAIISEKYGQTHERYRYVLNQVFHTEITYQNLYVFPTSNTIGFDIEKAWKSLLGKPVNGVLPKGRPIDAKYADWLRIAYYEPLNSGKEKFDGSRAPALSLGEKKNMGAG